MTRQLPPVDDDVFAELQRRAEPLVDDINSVLRRLLGMPSPNDRAQSRNGGEEQKDTKKVSGTSNGKVRRKRAKGKRRSRAPKGTLLPEDEYELPILASLAKLGGSAPASRVIEEVGEQLKAELQPADFEELDSGLVRWKNRTQFARLKLVKSGDMKEDSPRGVWEISDQGRARLKRDDAGPR